MGRGLRIAESPLLFEQLVHLLRMGLLFSVNVFSLSKPLGFVPDRAKRSAAVHPLVYDCTLVSERLYTR